jgi:O-antigen/teichoic acid export membrane protein
MALATGGARSLLRRARRVELPGADSMALSAMSLNLLSLAGAGGQSLRSRVLRAGAWTLVGHFASQMLRLGSNLIMTRLLVPEMFGIMALATVILVGLQLLSDLGLRLNIVQSGRGNDPVFLNTIWTVQIIRGAIISLVAVGVAVALHFATGTSWMPPASVYAEPVLPYLIAVLSLNALISGFESTKLATASRDLVLGKLTMIDLICQVAALIFMLAWVLIDRSIWALAVGSLVASLLRVVLSNVLLAGPRNHLHWDPVAFQEILRFGKWIFAMSIFGFLAANGDRLILGGLTDAKTLGMYSIAFFMVSALREVFSKLIQNVGFPAFSEVARERPALMKETYYKVRRPLDMVTLLAAGALFFAGHLLVQILYDHRYHPAGHMLEILSIGLFEVRYSIAGQCFLALGKPQLLVPIIAIQAIALYVFMPLAFAKWGFDGALWVVGGSALMTLPLTFYFKMKFGLFDGRQELRTLPWLFYGLALGWVIDRLARLGGWL